MSLPRLRFDDDAMMCAFAIVVDATNDDDDDDDGYMFGLSRGIFDVIFCAGAYVMCGLALSVSLYSCRVL